MTILSDIVELTSLAEAKNIKYVSDRLFYAETINDFLDKLIEVFEGEIDLEYHKSQTPNRVSADIYCDGYSLFNVKINSSVINREIEFTFRGYTKSPLRFTFKSSYKMMPFINKLPKITRFMVNYRKKAFELVDTLIKYNLSDYVFHIEFDKTFSKTEYQFFKSHYDDTPIFTTNDYDEALRYVDNLGKSNQVLDEAKSVDTFGKNEELKILVSFGETVVNKLRSLGYESPFSQYSNTALFGEKIDVGIVHDSFPMPFFKFIHVEGSPYMELSHIRFPFIGIDEAIKVGIKQHSVHKFINKKLPVIMKSALDSYNQFKTFMSDIQDISKRLSDKINFESSIGNSRYYFSMKFSNFVYDLIFYIDKDFKTVSIELRNDNNVTLNRWDALPPAKEVIEFLEGLKR